MNAQLFNNAQLLSQSLFIVVWYYRSVWAGGGVGVACRWGGGGVERFMINRRVEEIHPSLPDKPLSSP